MFKIEKEEYKKRIVYTNAIKNLKEYFFKISSYKAKDEEDKVKYDPNNFYAKKTREIDFNNTESALYSYLNGKNEERVNEQVKIYPFGLNESQLSAINMSFSNQISVIQGPPGTGKTQTILNIVANAIMNEETVAVVSPNNAATKNVYDKLNKNGYEFCVAELGNKKIEEIFLIKKLRYL